MHLRLPQHLAQWSAEVAIAAERYRLDAALLMAIIDRESRGGLALRPPGAGGTGDQGHGRGLMQIDDRWHADWIRLGVWKNPGANILKGAEILRGGIDFFLKRDDPDADFCGIAAYNCGPGGVLRAIRALPSTVSIETRRQHIDARTTGDDYAKDVLRRAASFRVPVIPPKCTLT
jgi:soluble lytic murein transglycosylase-like protein